MRFVDRSGDQVYCPPFVQRGTDFRGFVLQLDENAVAAHLRRMVNRPSGGVLRAAPTGDRALLSFAAIEQMRASDSSLGACRETDVTIWIPIELESPRGRQLAWWIPYIWVDVPTAVATGRETYGFPKAQADFEIPSVNESGRYSVCTDVLPERGVNARLERRTLLELCPTEARRAGSGVRDFAALLGPLARLEMLRGDVPVLFLRQLRDIENPSRAVFQEWVLAPARTLGVSERPRRLPMSHELQVHSTPSHPLGNDLGLRDQQVDAGFSMRFDFEMGLGTVLHRSRPRTGRKRRVAVLGGGAGSLTAAWALTELDADGYDITVYQRGWRLGGKGASGRNLDDGMRIEEHGLHIWFGFYDNAFRVLRSVYESLDRPADHPLPTLDEAFSHQDVVLLQEQRGEQWRPTWAFPFLRKPGVPGDGSKTLDASDCARGLWAWCTMLLRGESGVAGQAAMASVAALAQILRRLPDSGAPSLARLKWLRRALRKLLTRATAHNDDLYRHVVSIDFFATHLIGIVSDRVAERGFEWLDDEEYVDWLRRHGAMDQTCVSGPVRAVYDLAFAYQDGDTERPSAGAGTFLHGLLRLLLTYKGSFMYKMEGGMGDVVFTPFYEALKARGVKFRFFHEVDALRLSADGRHVESVDLAVQARTLNDEYEPLVDVDGLGVWPDRPLVDQLEDAARFADEPERLERAGAVRPVEHVRLRSGEDYDDVVLGIPVGAHRRIAAELIERHPRWRAMVDAVQTVCTHAVQLWTKPDLRGLGAPSGPNGEGPIQGAFAEPTDTWADMTHLARWERHEERPGHTAYFCGPWPDSDRAPEDEREAVFQHFKAFADGPLLELWPGARGTDGRFDASLLVGEPSLRGQYWRVNTDGSERYVLSVPGSTKHRLRAGDSGIDNLWLAGDWVRTGFSCGCIEATALSGLQCAAALSGEPVRIDGLWEQPGAPLVPDIVHAESLLEAAQ